MPLKKSLLNYWESVLLEQDPNRFLKNKNIWEMDRGFAAIENSPLKPFLNLERKDSIISEFGKSDFLGDTNEKSLKFFILAIDLIKKEPKSIIGTVFFIIPYTAIFTKKTEGSYELKEVLFPEKSRFNSACLEPSEKSLIIGHSDTDRLFLREKPTPSKTYQEHFSFANKHFEHVTGKTLKEFSIPRSSKDKELDFYLAIEEENDYKIKFIQETFKCIHSDDKGSLIDRITDCVEETEKVNLAISFDPKDYLVHSGQMDKSDNTSRIVYPIDSSQRTAIMSVLKMPDNSIQAINGPPGTGKTTMLQSLIASLWINHALEEKDPPIIVAAAATNQAVTNIIDSFGKIPNRHDTINIYSRWLPHIVSYGWFCPSITASKKPENSRFQKIIFDKKWRCLDEDHSQLFAKDTKKLEYVESWFKSCFETSFKESLQTVEQIKSFLYAKLKKNEALASSMIEDFFSLKAVLKKYSGGFLLKKSLTIQSEIQYLECLQIKNDFETSKIKVWFFIVLAIKLLTSPHKTVHKRAGVL